MQLNDRDIEIVVNLAIKGKQCMILLLRGNDITSVGASILAEALINNKTLKSLHLHGNRVSDSGAESLAKTLANNNHSFRDLSLGSNLITDSGCEHLAQMLKTNQLLIHLWLDNNEISDRGVGALCQAMKHDNVGLRILSLCGNALLTDTSVDSLCDIIKNHVSLTNLYVSGCNLSSTGKERLRKAAESKQYFQLHV